MSLRDDILADLACADALAAKDCHELARIRSIGRVRSVPTEIGNGTILEVLGIAAGNAFLDVINSAAEYRYVRPLLESGRFRVDLPLSAASIAAMVPAVLAQEQADALIAVAHRPDPLTAQDVAEAVFNPDGGLK